MIRNPLTVQAKDNVNSVLSLIRESGHTGYPVLDGEKLFGIVTEHDINRPGIDYETIEIKDICCKQVMSISVDSSVSEAFIKMLEKRVNRLPVVHSSDSTKMVGWITRSDIMRAYWISKYISTNEEYGLQDPDSWDPKYFEF